MKLIRVLITVMRAVFMVDTVYAFSTKNCGTLSLVGMTKILLMPSYGYNACSTASGMTFFQLFGNKVAEAHVNAKKMCEHRECQYFMKQLIGEKSPVGNCVVPHGLPYPVNCLELITALEKDCTAP